MSSYSLAQLRVQDRYWQAEAM